MLLALLEPYESKIPEKFTIIIEKKKEYNGTHYGKSLISITSRYIDEYLTNSDQEFIGQMIIECIGHELGHSKAFIGFPCPVLSEMVFYKLFRTERFRYHLVEVFCDHNSLEFTGFDKSIHQKAMLERKRVTKGNSEDLCHPTWEDRAVYIMRDFDEALIRKIAADNGCKSEKEILRQIDYYQKVFENDGYITKRAVVKTCFCATELILMIFGIILLCIRYKIHF